MDKLEKALQKARSERERTPMPQAARTRQQSKMDLPPPPLPEETDLPFDRHLESNRIVAHRLRSPEADLFRLLRTQVLQAMAKSGGKTLAITSPTYGNGKTTVAINLALSIALDVNQTVLLVDLDLRKPSVDKYLGLLPRFGLTDHLMADVPLGDCLQRLPFERLSILPAGQMFDNSSEVLSSPKMSALAEELKERYPDRLIIYDMPPLLAQDDPLAFLPQIDDVLLVIQDGVTREDELKRSLDTLAAANIIGTVLNAAP